jgi:hypothetical protein
MKAEFKHPLLKTIQQKYCDLLEAHNDLYAEMVRIRATFTKSGLTLEEMADSAFIFRECTALADDLRKEFSLLNVMAEQVTCLVWVEQNLNAADASQPIRARLCIATPDVGQMAALPKPVGNPVEYRALLDWLKIPVAVIEHDLVRPFWPAMTLLLTEMARLGKPLPAGIDPSKTYPVYKLRLMRNKEVEI